MIPALEIPAVITPAEARALGVGRRQVGRLLQDGRWERISGGYRTKREQELRLVDRWRAALLAVGGRAAISHTTAAKAFGWDLLHPDEQIHVTVARDRSRVTVPGVTVHRRVLRPDSLTHRQPLVLTDPVGTVLDLAAWLPFRDAVVAADAALRCHDVRHGELVAALVRRRHWGHHPRIRDVVSACDARSGSMPETVARLAFAQAGLPTPATQLQIRDESGTLIAVADFGWEDQRVVVEIDGVAYHSDPTAFRRDRARQNDLVTADWRVLRFTASDALNFPDRVADQVARVLAG